MSNPLDEQESEKVRKHLLDIRIIIKEGNLRDVVIRKVKHKDVLDIGVCEHTIDLVDKESWMHKQICDSAKSCLGIDIIEDLVNKLNDRGYNCKTVDATSDKDLGIKFDVINIGDVIEHVNNSVKLLEFAKRHIKQKGQILVSTPNPFLLTTLSKIFKEKTVVANLDHMSWITPSLAREIGIRAGLELKNYYVSHPATCYKKSLLFWLPVEFKSTNYLYVFGGFA